MISKTVACSAALAALLLLASAAAHAAGAGEVAWPAQRRQCRPWAYNWWMGSAVDKANLTRELERYRQGGLGGVHVVPIYGAKGAEDRYIPYLGPKWMEMLAHAVAEGERLDLGVDMTTGTGWCFGGPHVARDQGCRQIAARTVAFPSGGRLDARTAGGEVLYAAVVGSDDHYPEEAPAHQVTVEGFWMQPRQVTNAEFTEFTSTTGYLLPRAMLESKGIFQTLKWRNAGNANMVVKAVENKAADAGAAYESVFQVAYRTEPEKAKLMRVIAYTVAIPNGIYVARGDLPADTVRKLQKAFLGMNTDPAGRAAMLKAPNDKIVPPDDKLFDPVREVARVLNLNLEALEKKN